jgi:hypothetical protein
MQRRAKQEARFLQTRGGKENTLPVSCSLFLEENHLLSGTL